MSYFLGLLLLIILCFSLVYKVKASQTPDGWGKAIEVAKLISKNNNNVVDSIYFAKSDEDISNEHSIFYERASSEFGRRFIGWVEEDIQSKDVPSAVLKTVLYGYGYMGYLDHKSIFDSKEVFHSLNGCLVSSGLDQIPQDVIDEDSNSISKLSNQADIVNFIVQRMHSSVESLGFKILWFDEGGDSYSFFIVEISTYEKLQGTTLDYQHKFVSRPRF